jgi:hypothetical protein
MSGASTWYRANAKARRACSSSCLARVAQQPHVGAPRPGGGQEAGVGIIPLGARQPQREVEVGGGLDPGVGHVVAVADPRHGLPAHLPQVLPHGEEVGQHLAGVRQVGEPVDDGDVGVGGQQLHVGVREGADHDAVHVAREHARGVGDGLAAPQLHVARGEEVRGAAQLRGPHLEGHAGARGRLHEQHGQRLAGQRARRVGAGAHALGERQQRPSLTRGDVGEVEEVAVRDLPGRPGARRGGRAG